jgi:chromate reductase, NAD(P)H dehydrogenase (quinone)
VTTILGIAGSLRRGSYNAALLRALHQLAPPSVHFEEVSIRGIPLYDGDVEAESGLPESVRALKERIAAAGGVLLVTPEYNNSLPGPFKNAIDWLARPPADIPRVFGNRPLALCGATLGPGGTNLSQVAWLPVMRVLGVRLWFGRTLAVPAANKAFDESGALVDEKLRERARAFITGFAEFCSNLVE